MSFQKGVLHETSHHCSGCTGRLALLAACGSGEPTRKDYEAIKEGTPRSEVLEKFGEPDSGLSGFFGDIYNCGDQVVVIYYEVDYGSDAATVSKVTITKRQSPNG